MTNILTESLLLLHFNTSVAYQRMSFYWNYVHLS
ncbi:hypothetical protein SPRA44_690022 [Serratia proteamaculans]|nr:hypothetical protein SPRA44_690022 [Serratia proteamaculans]